MEHELVTLAIKDVIIEGRFRKDGKDTNDLKGLAASIARLGQLQAVGVTTDNRLVFGERRVKALQYLGRQTVLARVIDVESLLEAELDENQHRLEFSPTERAAIAKAIDAEMGNRQGQRTDRQLPGNRPEVQRGAETREVVAKKAGFANGTERVRVEKVIEHGTPELAAAMDAGAVSISAAADVATMPPEEQKAVVAAGPKSVKAAAKIVREKKGKLVKTDKPAPAADDGEVVALREENIVLKARVADLEYRLDEMADDFKETLNDNEVMRKVFERDDQLAAAVTQLQIETNVNRHLQNRVNGWNDERNALIRAANGYKKRADRFERELAALRNQMPTAA